MRLGHSCLWALLAVAAAYQNTAGADEAGGAYLGASFGRARNAYDTGSIDDQYRSEAAASGTPIAITSRSTHRLADVWWADAGYFMTPYVAIDAAFVRAGTLKYRNSGTVTLQNGDQPLNTSQEVTSHGPALSLVGRLPLSEHLEADLRVGAYAGKASYDGTLSVAGTNESSRAAKTSASLLAGVGAGYNFGAHWLLRVDYLRLNKTGSKETGKFSVDMATAGLNFIY